MTGAGWFFFAIFEILLGAAGSAAGANRGRFVALTKRIGAATTHPRRA
jgi:hypothetical protein